MVGWQGRQQRLLVGQAAVVERRFVGRAEHGLQVQRHFRVFRQPMLLARSGYPRRGSRKSVGGSAKIGRASQNRCHVSSHTFARSSKHPQRHSWGIFTTVAQQYLGQWDQAVSDAVFGRGNL